MEYRKGKSPRNKYSPDAGCMDNESAYLANQFKHADASVNLGSLIQLENGTLQKTSDGVLVLKPGLHNAIIDQNRSSIRCTTCSRYLKSIFFGTQSLHVSDYLLYYGNFRENILQRIAAYLKQ